MMGDMFTEEECIKALQNFYDELGKTNKRDFIKYQRYRSPCVKTIERKFGCWSKAVSKIVKKET